MRRRNVRDWEQRHVEALERIAVALERLVDDRQAPMVGGMFFGASRGLPTQVASFNDQLLGHPGPPTPRPWMPGENPDIAVPAQVGPLTDEQALALNTLQPNTAPPLPAPELPDWMKPVSGGSTPEA